MKSHLASTLTFGCLAWCLSLAGCATLEPESSAADSTDRESSAAAAGDDGGVEGEFEDKAFTTRLLNLRVHIMRDITFTVRGVNMTNSHITPAVVREQLQPELNRIWAQAGVSWRLESIVEENVIKSSNFATQKRIVEEATRDENGHSDDARLAPLYSFMNPTYMTKQRPLGNLFHIYIFPFIGNTSQGNAMRDFRFHTVVGSWSNKHNGGREPERRRNTEDPGSCVKGSLGRTIAHELGHVLSLQHNQCDNCLMAGCGYSITSSQISTARAEARNRLGL